MEDLKNNITNVVTIAGTGSVVIGASEVLTLALLVTGIAFNVIRMCEIRRKRLKEEAQKKD